MSVTSCQIEKERQVPVLHLPVAPKKIAAIKCQSIIQEACKKSKHTWFFILITRTSKFFEHPLLKPKFCSLSQWTPSTIFWRSVTNLSAAQIYRFSTKIMTFFVELSSVNSDRSSLHHGVLTSVSGFFIRCIMYMATTGQHRQQLLCFLDALASLRPKIATDNLRIR